MFSLDGGLMGSNPYLAIFNVQWEMFFGGEHFGKQSAVLNVTLHIYSKNLRFFPIFGDNAEFKMLYY